MKKTIEYSQKEVSDLLAARHPDPEHKHFLITWNFDLVKCHGITLEIFDNEEDCKQAQAARKKANEYQNT